MKSLFLSKGPPRPHRSTSSASSRGWRENCENRAKSPAPGSPSPLHRRRQEPDRHPRKGHLSEKAGQGWRERNCKQPLLRLSQPQAGSDGIRLGHTALFYPHCSQQRSGETQARCARDLPWYTLGLAVGCGTTQPSHNCLTEIPTKQRWGSGQLGLSPGPSCVIYTRRCFSLCLSLPFWKRKKRVDREDLYESFCLEILWICYSFMHRARLTFLGKAQPARRRRIQASPAPCLSVRLATAASRGPRSSQSSLSEPLTFHRTFFFPPLGLLPRRGAIGHRRAA